MRPPSSLETVVYDWYERVNTFTNNASVDTKKFYSGSLLPSDWSLLRKKINQSADIYHGVTLNLLEEFICNIKRFDLFGFY